MYVSPINEIVRLQHNLKAAGQQKRGRHPVFNANMLYPRKLENELNDLLRAELERIFLENMAVALNGLGLRDDVAEMNAAPVVLSSGFLEKSKNFAERVNANAGDTYQKQVEMIIGRPYYPPTAQREILEAWHDEFQALCISAGQDGKKKIAMTVAVAKEKGWNKKQTEEVIRALLPVETKHRAELIARTETGKLNSRCVRETYAQTGVKYYKWLTTIDGRERETHAAMNGKICDVSDPDVIYEENPDNPLRPIKKNKTGEMVHLHPGQDFQCRCTMVMWEPEIDGKYEVTEDHEREEAERLEMEEKARQEEAERKAKEREAEEEKKRQEAEEKARAEMEKKAQQRAEAKYKRELKKAEEAAKKAQEAEAKANGATRKAEILQKANERHAKRTEEEKNKIKAKWEIFHPFSIMPIKFDNMGDFEKFFNRIDDNRNVLGLGRFMRGGSFVYAGNASGCNGKTNCQGKVYLSKEKETLTLSALNKIRNGESITQKEDYALCTLWHEISHNRHEFMNYGIVGEIVRGDTTKYMEMTNEYVARNTMLEFYKVFGIKKLPFEDIKKNRPDTGYNDWVRRLDKAVTFFGIDENKFLEACKAELFDGVYNKQKEGLVRTFMALYPEMNSKQAGKIVKVCISRSYYGADLQNFEETTLKPILEEIESKRKPKKKKS